MQQLDMLLIPQVARKPLKRYWSYTVSKAFHNYLIFLSTGISMWIDFAIMFHKCLIRQMSWLYLNLEVFRMLLKPILSNLALVHYPVLLLAYIESMNGCKWSQNSTSASDIFRQTSGLTLYCINISLYNSGTINSQPATTVNYTQLYHQPEQM